MKAVRIPKHEVIATEELLPHPQNYRNHPEDQLEHIIASLRKNGFYRSIVVARDNTILAGHGVHAAAIKMGLSTVPIVRINIAADHPNALKLVVGDNHISHLAEGDDRALADLLKRIKEESDDALLGTGFDDMMLANLAFVTRPESEIRDFDAAQEWAGMPEFGDTAPPIKVSVAFRSEEDRLRFCEILDIPVPKGQRGVWWPPKQNDDISSVKFRG